MLNDFTFESPYGPVAFRANEDRPNMVPDHVTVYDFIGDVDVVNNDGYILLSACYVDAVTGHPLVRDKSSREARKWLIEFVKLRYGVNTIKRY